MFRKLSFLIIIFSFLFLKSAYAGKGDIVFVEANVDLQSNGVAVVAYTVQWRVLSGELHGFYFQKGARSHIDKVSSESYAVDSSGKRYALDISTASGGKLDIVLANGRGVSAGTVTYVFSFLTDLAKAGYVDYTTSSDED